MSDTAKDQEMSINQYVTEGNIEQATALVSELELPSYLEAYNLAYIKYKSGSLVEARYLLEKAQASGMFSQEVTEALTMVKDDLGISYAEQDQTTLDNLMLMGKSLPNEFFPSLTLLCLIIWGVLTLKKKFVLSVFPAVLALVLGIFYYANLDTKVAINVDEIPVYRGPSRIFEEIQVLPQGAKFIISKEVNDWKYISYPSIYRGWVYKNKALML